MKQRVLLIFTLLFVSMSMFSQNTRANYESNWKKVEEHNANSLPQSAIKEVEAILGVAVKDKNTPQIMKAYVYLQDLKYQVDSDTDFDMIVKLEDLLSKTTKVEDAALLHSVLADMYLKRYKADRWKINQRTNLSDEVPADMKEWTANIFENKVFDHLAATIENKDLLKNKVTNTYDDIIYLGKDSKIYYPTLFDFVMNRTIKTAKSLREIGREEFDVSSTGASIKELVAPAKDYTQLKLAPSKKYIVLSYYQQYLSDLQERGLEGTVVLTELDKYNYLKSLSNNFDKKLRLETLISYEELYSGNETTVEIIDAIADELENDHYYMSYRRMPIADNGDQGDKDAHKKMYTWLQKGIKKYPNYARIGILKNSLASLEAPTISVHGKNLFYAENDVFIDVVHKNGQVVGEKDKTLQLFKSVDGKEKLERNFTLNFTSTTTYDADTAKLEMGSLPLGRYIIRSESAENEHDKYMFAVSDLMTYSRNSAKNEYEIFVVDRMNGKPVKGATITLYEARYNKRKEDAKVLSILTTNELGVAAYKEKVVENDRYRHEIAAYTVTMGDDNGLEDQILYSGSYNYARNESGLEEQNRNTISIFADRSIYRPGQTLQMKAIVIDKNSKVVASKKQVVKLYNPHGEVVAEKTLFTNDFGSIATEFVLPQGGLLGSHWITVGENNYLYFRVEEYKRPTFEVKFDKIDKTYGFGDKVILKGNAKTFSGISLQDADVRYRITRRPFSFWFWNTSNESHYSDGVVKTKDDGTFEIEFTPEAGDGQKLFGRNIYTFNITADITDLNGETQSNTYTISVGEQSMILNVEIPHGKIEKSQDVKIKIGAKNLDGADIETAGTYNVYTLDKNDSIQTKVLGGAFKTGEQNELVAKIKKLNSGKLRIEVIGKDDKDREVKSHSDFVLYSFSDKKPPYETDLWVAEKETTFKGKTPAEVIYGTSNKDVYVLYQLYVNKTVFERKFVKMSNENNAFKVPYKAEYGDEIYMSFTTVKDGELSTQNILLKKEEEKKETNLKIKLDVFRDKLRPGQEETWTMSIRDDKDKAVTAEVLASMYDTSLDQINPFAAWMLSRPYIYKEYLNQMYFNSRRLYTGSYGLVLNYDLASIDVKQFDFDRFNFWPAFKTSGLDEVVVVGYSRQKTVRMTGAVAVRGDKVNDFENSDAIAEQMIMQESAPVPSMGGNVNASKPQPQIRRNFNETAFFFPQLKTNEKGETVVSFTVPESNTTWRFRAFAHDKDSKVGELEKMVVTRKELMVTPNMPRFVRHGDKTSIITKVSNLSENAISGNVRLEFFNPIDEKVVDLGLKDVSQAFNLAKDASTSATWTFDVPSDIDMVGVRIVAESESFSDGEQHVLAVLPNRMLVTETMPVDVLDKGEQTYTLDKLANNKSNTLDNYKLTFEFASNPAWYAVQALPTLSNPTDDNVVSWFASYYVNTLGTSLMKQYPKVANVIEAWKKQGGDKETLVSKLSKDEELKTILLEETPWVLDAKSETEQMERLSLLFDLNSTKQKTSTALDKLNDLQVSEGGWSWYKGMYASRSITQYLLYGFANLQLVGMVEHPEQVKMMQMNALKSVDESIVKDFENLKKYNKDWKNIKSISTSQLEYLYIRAMYRDIPISQEAREAERFYTEVISKNWTKIGLYEKSLLAVLLPQLGDKALAAKVTASIKEHSVTKKEMGMYWPNNKANVFLSQSAVSTHTFMMEAMKANGATTEEMDMMKRWLVKQKQTQIWESTHATIDAISALLKEGSNWFESDAVPTIKVGKEVVKPENKELATGYFKTSWSKSEIKSDMAKVTINSEDSKPAYGSLYWQYYEDLDKITKQDGALNVNKELYKEVVDKSGKSLVKITESNALEVGDKVIVRLVVRTDRNLEFVQLKDMRASCFEPANAKSGISWQNGAPYYETTKDASTNFFFDVLPKGTYVFEYPVYVNRSGEYSNGITSIQCAYAPEFTSHTAGIKVIVK